MPKDLSASFDLPAERWKHSRTADPIESTFGPVRLRTYTARGCCMRETPPGKAFQPLRIAGRKVEKSRWDKILAHAMRAIKLIYCTLRSDLPLLDVTNNT